MLRLQLTILKVIFAEIDPVRVTCTYSFLKKNRHHFVMAMVFSNLHCLLLVEKLARDWLQGEYDFNQPSPEMSSQCIFAQPSEMDSSIEVNGIISFRPAAYSSGKNYIIHAVKQKLPRLVSFGETSTTSWPKISRFSKIWFHPPTYSGGQNTTQVGSKVWISHPRIDLFRNL